MRRRKTARPGSLIPLLLPAASVLLMFAPASWVQPGRALVLAVTAPIELAVSGAIDGVASMPDRLRGSDHLLEQCRSLSAEKKELTTEVGYLRVQLLDRDKLIAQLRDLKAVLPKTGYDAYPAQIVGKERAAASAGAVAFTLAIGADSGVRRDDLVVTGYAVVGRVISVSAGACQVQVVTNGEFRLPARTPDGVEAVLKGGPGDRCQLNYVDARAAIKPGDYVVTSGFESRYPPGLLLGTVETIQRSRNSRLVDVIVKPAALLDGLSQVIIVRRRDGK